MELMLRVAITGNIASGKSTVEGFLKEANFKALDTDEIAHTLLNKKPVEDELLEAFSGLDVLEDNKISRYKLGKIVFADSEQRKKLEAILHPLIKDEIEKFFIDCEKEGEEVAFVSIPLLFEAGFEDLFEKIILVHSPDEQRLQRLIGRNNLTTEQAQNRLNIQQNQDEKKLLADYIIYNDKDLNELKNRTHIVLKRISNCMFIG